MKIQHFLLVMGMLLLASCEEKEVVVDMRIKSIILSEETLAIDIGQSATLTATLETQDAPDRSITWSSSNTEIATVNNGSVTGVAYGQAVVTATAANGKEAWCNVTVNYPPPISITLNKTTLSLLVGAQETLIATMLPAVAEQQASWSSNNTAVASVSDDGVITALLNGTATITATTSNNLTATCVVTAEKLPATGIQMETVTLEVGLGHTAQAIARVLPFPGAIQTVAWSSNNPSIASVNADGIVSGEALGEAILTATAVENTAYQATCTVAIVPLHTLTLNEYTGSKVTINYTDGVAQEHPLENEQTSFVSVNKIIRSITLENGSTILIGRNAGSGNITLKISGSAVTFRDAVDGFVPIGSYAEFRLVSGALAGSYKMEADLDLMNETWVPIASPFTGVFDGDHHTVANIKVTATGDKGLFARLQGGTIKNVGIASGTIGASNIDGFTGGITGYIMTSGTISGCFNNATVASSANNIGGIAGYCYSTNDTRIIACYNSGNVEGQTYVGGIVGNINNNNNAVIACYNTGRITTNRPNGTYMGGISGSSGTIIACYNTGEVIGHTGAPAEAIGGTKQGCYRKDGSGTGTATVFGSAAWPSTGANAQWGIGDGSGDGKYWKSLGGWNGGNPEYPKLFFEE